MDLNEIVVFARVVQAGSFSAAARQLGMPKSTVSRKVSELEDRVGARLLQRTTRKLGLTDAGRIYFDHGARIVAELEQAEQAVSRMQSAPQGLLRITAPLSFWMLGPLVSAFLERYPDVQVEMTCTDRLVDLVEDGFDIGVRAGPLSDSTLVARSLGGLSRVLVAAPGYCKRRGTPKTPQDLAKHSCLTFRAGTNQNQWVLVAGEDRVEVRVSGRMAANDFWMLADAARGGLGIALLPRFQCAEDLRAGRLRHVLESWSSPETPVHLVYPTARHLSPKVSAFVEFARGKLQLAG